MDSKNGGVAVARGWNVKKIDVVEQKVYLEDSKEISYEKCLIATGAQPKNLPVFEEADEEIKEKVYVLIRLMNAYKYNILLLSSCTDNCYTCVCVSVCLH